MKCKNCIYFMFTEDPYRKGKEYCCFRELGHGEEELAPCDDPDYDDEQEKEGYDELEG